MTQVLVDSGFLVALGIASDPRHRSADAFLSRCKDTLLIPAPVVAETCFFLSTTGKVRMLDWLGRPGRRILDVPVTAFEEIGAILSDYASLDPDFTDAAIVWLAGTTGCDRILTTDQRDFGVYRIRGRKRFELVKWFGARSGSRA